MELLLFCHLFPPFGLSVGLSPLTSLLYNLTYSDVYFLYLSIFSFTSCFSPLRDSSPVVFRSLSPSSAVVFPSLRCGPIVVGCGSNLRLNQPPPLRSAPGAAAPRR